MKFTTRKLLIAVTVLCVLIGILASRADSQRRAVQIIEKLGGKVSFRDDMAMLGNWFANPSPSSITKHLGHSAISVRLTFHQYDDEMKIQLGRLPHLARIELYGHDAKFGAEKIAYDFPTLDIVDGYAGSYSYNRFLGNRAPIVVDDIFDFDESSQ